MSWFASIPADELTRVDFDRREFLFDTGFQGPDGKPHLVALDVYPVSWNLVLYGSAVVMVPWRRLPRRWVWLIAGSLVLFASHVIYFALSTVVQVAQMYEGVGQGFWSPEWRQFLGRTVQGYNLTLGNLLPFLLAIPLFLGRESSPSPPRRPRPDRKRKVGPNDPCPCGSGRKYKRCCRR